MQLVLQRQTFIENRFIEHWQLFVQTNFRSLAAWQH